MAALYTNNASTILASGITNSATSLTVSSGQGSKFPSPTGIDYFMCTLQGISGTPVEIVKVTARSTDTFTIVRAQEGTTASAFSANDIVELRITAGEMTQVNQLGIGNASIMKNRIINGAMVIAQRGTGTTSTAFLNQVDQFQVATNYASSWTFGQSSTAPTGFIKSALITNSAVNTASTSQYYSIRNVIEGLNITDLGWGTANAKTVTLSFWVYSSLTGSFGGSIFNGSANYSYPFLYTVSSANTWTQISVTIVGPTSGTWATDNGTGMFVEWSLGCGSNYMGTAGSWSANRYQGATGQVQISQTNGATFYITGVQLEIGSSATGFEYVNYQTSLANCQRYYAKGLPSSVYGSMFWQGNTTSGVSYYTSVYLPVTMRTTPTATYTNVTTSGFTGTPVALDISATVLISGQSCNSTATGSYYGMNYTASAEL